MEVLSNDEKRILKRCKIVLNMIKQLSLATNDEKENPQKIKGLSGYYYYFFLGNTYLFIFS